MVWDDVGSCFAAGFVCCILGMSGSSKQPQWAPHVTSISFQLCGKVRVGVLALLTSLPVAVAAFDCPILIRNMEKAGAPLLPPARLVDTLAVARKLLKDLTTHKLQVCVWMCGMQGGGLCMLQPTVEGWLWTRVCVCSALPAPLYG